MADQKVLQMVFDSRAKKMVFVCDPEVLECLFVSAGNYAVDATTDPEYTPAEQEEAKYYACVMRDALQAFLEIKETSQRLGVWPEEEEEKEPLGSPEGYNLAELRRMVEEKW